MNIYKTKRWQRVRERILKRDGYQCQESRRYGKRVSATTVHHIYPLEEYPELAFKDWNLVSLSQPVHNTMHDRNTNEITPKGKEWQERRRAEYEAFLKSPPQISCERA